MLKSIRAREDMTQKPVAKAAGMDVTTYCQKENGKVPFTDQEIFDVAIFLNMTIGEVNVVFFGNKLTDGKRESAENRETA
jgi:transcriptional regulator with XRE-family HTH domain